MAAKQILRSVLILVAGCLVAGQAKNTPHPEVGIHRQAEGHGHHRFQDAERWAAVFESEERDRWQQPDKVIRFLALRRDDKIADIGSATGYFPVRFAPHVREGHVYGVDIEPDMVRFLNERAVTESLSNLTSVLASFDDPRIPEKVDVVFVCDTYHHISDRVAYLKRLKGDIAPGGRVVIVDFLPGPLPIGPPPSAKLTTGEVEEEFRAAGYKLAREVTLPYQYMLLFVVDTGIRRRPGPGQLMQTLGNMTDADGKLPSGTTIILDPGHYRLDATAYLDPTCGNCEDPASAIPTTVGLRISGAGIVIEGSGTSPDETILETGAGYGLLFEDCDGCEIRNLTVTGGVRGVDDRSTDGAIVVRRSSVKIENLLVTGNIGDPAVVSKTVVGICGIVGREGADLEIVGNRIERNSWDGIVLYRGARAHIAENRIDGVDKARGSSIGGGRGVGIGVTWDSRATIEHNWITRYWKGIGIFVDARADVSENIVEEILAWGIAYWDGGNGRPVARIERNLIYDTGACGILITRQDEEESEPGHCVENIIVRTGQNADYDDPELYCSQVPISIEHAPPSFSISYNLFTDNRRADEPGDHPDLPLDVFRSGAASLLDSLMTFGTFRESQALQTLIHGQ